MAVKESGTTVMSITKYEWIRFYKKFPRDNMITTSRIKFNNDRGISVVLDSVKFGLWFAPKNEYPVCLTMSGDISQEEVKTICNTLGIPFSITRMEWTQMFCLHLTNIADIFTIKLIFYKNLVSIHEDAPSIQTSELVAYFGIQNELAEWMLANPETTA